MVVQDIFKKREDLRILLVGKNSMIAREFVRQYSQKHEIISIGREDDVEQIIRANDNFDSVIFLAQSADYKKTEFTEDIFKTNLTLLHATLQRVASKTKQFIYFSTGSVYKENETGVYKEDDSLNVDEGSPYVASKIAGEIIVSSFKSAFKSTVVLRPFYMYGKEQREGMLFRTMFKNVFEGEQITLNGNDGLVFNPVHAEDVARLLEHLILSVSEGYKVYNVGGKEVVTLRSVINIMAGHQNTEANIIVNTGKSTSLVGEVNVNGWEPVVSVKEGIYKTFYCD